MDNYAKDRVISVAQSALVERGITNLSLAPYLWTLFKHLPMLIYTQHDYENRTVNAGLQLLFSDYLKSLVVLAFSANLHYVLPYKPIRPRRTNSKEVSTDWQWFYLLNVAIQTAEALVSRSPFPEEFISMYKDIAPG